MIDEDWKNSWTLGSEICRIKNAADGRKEVNEDCVISIQTENDIIKAIEILQEYFLHISVPFYQKYSNLAMIDELYNEPPFENMPVLVQRTLADQCMKGLISAKLIGRTNYNELVATFDKLIMTLDDNGIHRKYLLAKTYLSKL